ncbi:MAG: domain 2, partial [Pseudomonadota bacterium]
MDLRQLVRAFDGGRIDADTLVWRKGMPDWRRLRDVAELAERLMGADATKAAVPDPALDSVRAEAEPPPRHAERSRTPAASYSVGGSQGRGSVPPPSLERISVSSSGEELVAATLPGGSMPATPAGGYSSPAPPRTSTRPERRSVPSPAPTPLAGRAPIMGEPPRTITQTGLAPAPDPAHRLVHSTAAEAPITEEPEAIRGGSAAAGTPRASRTPAPGPRRVPSSDETPAQKPSSISVSSGALAAAPLRLRTKHLVALGALVLGVVLIVRGTLSSEAANGASASNGSPEPHAVPPAGLPELPHVENR